MLKIVYDPIYIHPLPVGHRFPMLKYELIPAQLLHEGLIGEENLFSPGELSEEIILWTHEEAYWQQLRNLTLPPKRAAPYRLSLIGPTYRTRKANSTGHHRGLPLRL